MTAHEVRKTNRLIGAPVKRKEDSRLLRGRGNFVDDLNRPGMLHAAFFRSDVASRFAEIRRGGRCRQIAGVVGVFTARDIAPFLRPLVAHSTNASYQSSEIPILAREKVIFVGQPVAMVVAESRHKAEDAVDAIRAEYENLPPVLDLESATLGRHRSSTTMSSATPTIISTWFRAISRRRSRRPISFSIANSARPLRRRHA